MLITYRLSDADVKAKQWFKNGDHVDDDCANPAVDEGKVVRRYRHPNISGEFRCEICGFKMEEHGWIDQGMSGLTVCPRSFIISLKSGKYFVVSEAVFRELFEVKR